MGADKNRIQQCRKTNYPTKENAEKAMKLVNDNPKIFNMRSGKKVRRVYECKFCFNWHLTSKK